MNLESQYSSKCSQNSKFWPAHSSFPAWIRSWKLKNIYFYYCWDPTFQLSFFDFIVSDFRKWKNDFSVSGLKLISFCSWLFWLWHFEKRLKHWSQLRKLGMIRYCLRHWAYSLLFMSFAYKRLTSKIFLIN